MLNERLKQLRNEKELSQYEVAKRLGFSRGQLANYEQGSRQPDYDTLTKLADFYGCTIDYLLGRSDSKQLTKDEQDLIVDSKKLTIKQVQDKYKLTVGDRAATNEEVEVALKLIRSVPDLKQNEIDEAIAFIRYLRDRK